MSDLSRLLDDVYGDQGTSVDAAPPEPTPTLTGLPDWAMDSVLDEAFADWVPGPPTATSDAPVADGPFEQVVGHPHRPAFGDPTGEAMPNQEPASAWTRADDDILPTKRGRSSGRSRSARRSAAAPDLAPVPTIESFAADDEQAPARHRRFGGRRS